MVVGLWDLLFDPENSIWVYRINAGSCNGCEIEITPLFTPRYDAERFGIKWVATPRHADVVLITGPVTAVAKDSVLEVLSQVPDPKVVIAVGSCGVSGGVFRGSYALRGPIDNLYPVDLYVLGCPPKPEGILTALLEAKKILKAKRKGVYEAKPLVVDPAGMVMRP